MQSINTGFVASKLLGIIFNLNQSAADLLGSDRKALLAQSIVSILSDFQSNEDTPGAITQHKLKNLNSFDDNDLDSLTADKGSTNMSTLNVNIEVNYHYNSVNKSTNKTV